MGASFRKLFNRKKEARFLMQGLDAVGKTTILYKLKLGEVVTTIPTIGFNVETVNYKSMSFTAWDVGGRDKIRPLYRHYYPNTDAFVYVVDSNDKERIDQAEEELSMALSEDELRGVPLIVFLNKQDLPDAMSVTMACEKLKLHDIRGRLWYIQPCCATTGDGLYEGLDWMIDAINRAGQPAPENQLEPQADSKPDHLNFTWMKAYEKFKAIFIA